MTDYSQSNILDQMVRYIHVKSKANPAGYRNKDTEWLKKELDSGHCFGLTCLWLYYKYHNREKEFYKILKAIASWDGKKSTLKKHCFMRSLDYETNTLVRTFENLISHMRVLHLGEESYEEKYYVPQNFQKFIKILGRDPNFKCIFRLSFVFTEKELKKVFDDILIPNTMILLEDDSHAVGVIVKDGKIYYYDSNDPTKAREVKNTKHLARIFNKIEEKGRPDGKIPFKVSIFTDNPKIKMKVSAQDIIDVTLFERYDSPEEYDLNDKVRTKKKLRNPDAYNPIYAAAEIGDLSSIKMTVEEYGVKLKKHADAFEQACTFGHTNIVRYFIDKGFDAEFADNAFKFACANGHEEIVQMLIDEGANNKKALTKACQYGNYKIAKLLIRNFIGDVRNNPQALVEACRNGHTKIVNLLIKKRTNVIDNEKALEVACLNGHYDIVKLLIDNDANVRNNPVPLREACKNGNTRIIDLLVRNDAKVKRNTIALENAINNGHHEAISYLVKNKAGARNFDIIEKACYAAAKFKNFSILEPFLNKILKRHDADDKILEIFKMACKNKKLYYVALMLRLGYINKRVMKKALKIACQYGKPNTVRLFNGDFKIGKMLDIAQQCRKKNPPVIRFLKDECRMQKKRVNQRLNQEADESLTPTNPLDMDDPWDF